MENTEEHKRIESYHLEKSKWKKWGPYLSDRAWGTVREDYSSDGDVWSSLSYEGACSKAYRWNEDGIGGVSDRYQHICFAPTFWNGKDPLLKERLFGLAGPEGNHGEDVKEYYFYIDNTPTHSYMKMIYKYPQKEFPYEKLIVENKKRSSTDCECELLDTGIFEESRYFDIEIEYAKAGEEDLLISFSISNRGPEKAVCYLLPTLWLRNTWSWGYEQGPSGDEPGKGKIRKLENSLLECSHPSEGTYYLHFEEPPASLLFTENDTNHEKLYGVSNAAPYVKDAFHRFLIHSEAKAVNPSQEGTKAAGVYQIHLDPGHTKVFRLRLSKERKNEPFKDFSSSFSLRKQEADDFYKAVQNPKLNDQLKLIQRQAFAGLLWNKQFYYLDMEQWQKGDPIHKASRQSKRNLSWTHLTTFDILSMPDKWEYPYFCSWDLAFHCIPYLLIDSDFAKRQITLMTREWYMHPNGQLPAYEWSFSDVNPPVLAWAAWRAYKIDAKIHGKPDRDFLKGIFSKLLLNFTWWVNRKDEEGNNVFQGGFLGLDNISVFDRSAPLPTGGHIDQSDGTAWMAFYCTLMLKISLHLSLEEPIYQDIATKFFEHFLRIAQAMSHCGGHEVSLWDKQDGFFYDVLHLPNDSIIPLKVRSIVGLLPLLSVETLEPEIMEKLSVFSRRLDWFVKKRPLVSLNLACVYQPGVGRRRMLAILTEDRLKSVLKYMLDEGEFLSDYGIRSLSKYHEKHPYVFSADGGHYEIRYVPSESDNRMFGGNSNWRGPIWFPINFLIIESLQKFHHYYGDAFKVECPTGSGKWMNLKEVAEDLSKRLIRLFMADEKGKRPIFGNIDLFQKDPHWKDLLLFNEYFHGETGKGLGASHQTGWTALLAKLIQQTGEAI